MIRYDLDVLIGHENTDSGPMVKCHDTGATLAVHLKTCKKASRWREEKAPYIIPDGSKAFFRASKPDKTSINTDVGVSMEGKSTVICEGIVQAFTAAGICDAEIVLYDPDGKRLTSATFSYEVTPECVSCTDTSSADYFDVLSADIQVVKDAAKTANEAADKAIGLSANPPKLSENYTWLVWNSDIGCYVDTGISGRGAQGPQGLPGEQGPQGIPGGKGDPGFITGSGAPTTATEGEVGQLYMDTDTGELYKCTAVEDGVHTWDELVEKGIPRFDLVHIGLPTVPIGDIGALCECDTTEIVKAAGYGPISVDVDTAAGRYIVTMNPIISSGAVQLAGVFCMVMDGGFVVPYAASIVLGDGYVRAFITELAAAAALGDISTALDHIIAIQKDIMGIIVFYIDGVAYYADNTGDAPQWPVWLNSTYNTLGVYRGSADSCLYTPDGGKIYNSEGVHQTAWANIHDGDVYTIHYEEVAE